LKDANTLLVAKKIGNSYFVLQDEESARSAHVDLSYPEWHAALGHPSAALPTFSHMYADGHLLPSPPPNFHCEPCALAKSTHSVPPPHAARSSRKLELIHSDLARPINTPSLTHEKYIMTFIDDFTRCAWVTLLKDKTQAQAALISFVTTVQRRYDTKVIRFRTDGGTEYVNNKVLTFFQE